MKRALALLVLASCVSGGDAPDDDSYWTGGEDDEAEPADPTAAQAADGSVAITPGTLDKAEQVDLLPVGKSEGAATRRVVMRLSPSELPKLVAGDRLFTPAESQVTTRCDIGQVAPGCGYSPHVGAEIIITGRRDDTKADGSASRSIAKQDKVCTKDAHHCMFVFTPSDTKFDVGNLPCVQSNSCYVNLVMWAWDSQARSGGDDKVIVGGNEGNFLENGQVDHDMGRLMALREHHVVASDRKSDETSGGGDHTVPTNASPVTIYSHELKNLKKGEVVLLEAKVEASSASRARISTQLVISKSPKGNDNHSAPDAIAPGQINEQNGYNCNNDTCTYRKVAVFHVTQDITDSVYVNLISRSEIPGGGTTRVVVKGDKGWLRSMRYRAALGQ